MRETFGSLITQSQKYCLNDTSGGTLTFIKSEINRAQRFIYAELSDYLGLRTQTSATVASQQYYHLPPDGIHIETCVITINGVNYTLISVDSQKQWDILNAIQVQPTALPEFFFSRIRDFGIWPIPQAAYTITLTYQWEPVDMTQTDYATGTITLTNHSQTVTGAATTFASWMADAWLSASRPLGDGQWYKVSTYGTPTTLTLEEAYQGSTLSSLSYTIGESPDIPGETHELIPYRVSHMYFLTQRKDPAQAQVFSNLFWTGDPALDENTKDAQGGFMGTRARYAKRSEDRVIRKKFKISNLINSKLFAEKITG
jgi:hypothetical protein